MAPAPTGEGAGTDWRLFVLLPPEFLLLPFELVSGILALTLLVIPINAIFWATAIACVVVRPRKEKDLDHDSNGQASK